MCTFENDNEPAIKNEISRNVRVVSIVAFLAGKKKPPRIKTYFSFLHFHRRRLPEPYLNEVRLLPQINTPSANCEEDVMGYGVHPCEEMLSAASPVRTGNQARSPASLRRYQLEQNPDLINGTESIGCRREGDGEDERNQDGFQGEQHVGPMVAGPFPIACLRGSAEFYSDIRWV